MANLTNSYVSLWVGDKSECIEYNVYDLKDKLSVVYQMSQSGTSFIVQRAENANDVFALIEKPKLRIHVQ